MTRPTRCSTAGFTISAGAPADADGDPLITVSGFPLVLGLAALLAAFSRIWRTDLPVLAICLLIIGASLVAKPLLTKTT